MSQIHLLGKFKLAEPNCSIIYDTEEFMIQQQTQFWSKANILRTVCELISNFMTTLKVLSALHIHRVCGSLLL